MFGAYGQLQRITANCHVRAVQAPHESESGEWISRMVGNTTIVKEDATESRTRLGTLKNVSRTCHEVSRPLPTPTPDEIMDLREDNHQSSRSRQRRARVKQLGAGGKSATLDFFGRLRKAAINCLSHMLAKEQGTGVALSSSDMVNAGEFKDGVDRKSPSDSR
jgi:hypothetical protein